MHRCLATRLKLYLVLAAGLIVLLLATTPASEAAEAVWKVRNMHGKALKLYLRPVEVAAFGEPITLPPQEEKKVGLTGPDPYFIEMDLGDGVRVISDRPMRLRAMAATGHTFPILLAFTAEPGQPPKPACAFVREQGGSTSLKILPAPPELERLRRSEWRTTYGLPDGGSIAAKVRLDGDEGTYRTASFDGRLRDIHFARDKEKFYVSGRWRAGDQAGTFLWTLDANDPSRFRGEWLASGGGERFGWEGAQE